MEEEVDAFVEAQVVKHDDNKWGNKLSSKVRGCLCVGVCVWGGAGRQADGVQSRALRARPCPPTHHLCVCVCVRAAGHGASVLKRTCTTACSPPPTDPPTHPSLCAAQLFMAREFVLKHIRNKHGHVLDEERARVCELVYWENFRWVPFNPRVFGAC